MPRNISDVEILHNELLKRASRETKDKKRFKKRPDNDDMEFTVEEAPEPQYSVGFIIKINTHVE